MRKKIGVFLALALHTSVLSSVYAASPTATDMEMFTLDLLPTEAISTNPEGAVFERIPKLRPLVDRISFMPSNGSLVVFANPDKLPEIRQLIYSYLHRPQFVLFYEMKTPEGIVVAFPVMASEGSDTFAGNTRTIGAPDDPEFGYAFAAKLKKRGDVVEVTVVSSLTSAPGQTSSFQGMVALHPGTSKTLAMTGHGNVSLTLTIQPFKFNEPN